MSVEPITPNASSSAAPAQTSRRSFLTTLAAGASSLPLFVQNLHAVAHSKDSIEQIVREIKTTIPLKATEDEIKRSKHDLSRLLEQCDRMLQKSSKAKLGKVLEKVERVDYLRAVYEPHDRYIFMVGNVPVVRVVDSGKGGILAVEGDEVFRFVTGVDCTGNGKINLAARYIDRLESLTRDLLLKIKEERDADKQLVLERSVLLLQYLGYLLRAQGGIGRAQANAGELPLKCFLLDKYLTSLGIEADLVRAKWLNFEKWQSSSSLQARLAPEIDFNFVQRVIIPAAALANDHRWDDKYW